MSEAFYGDAWGPTRCDAILRALMSEETSKERHQNAVRLMREHWQAKIAYEAHYAHRNSLPQ